jgi:hypothetical protein
MTTDECWNLDISVYAEKAQRVNGGKFPRTLLMGLNSL